MKVLMCVSVCSPGEEEEVLRQLAEPLVLNQPQDAPQRAMN